MAENSNGALFPGLFVGEYDHVLDAQCRVSLPSEWRSKDAGTELMMIPTRDKALLLLPLATFMEFVSKAGKRPSPTRKCRWRWRFWGGLPGGAGATNRDGWLWTGGCWTPSG